MYRVTLKTTSIGSDVQPAPNATALLSHLYQTRISATLPTLSDSLNETSPRIQSQKDWAKALNTSLLRPGRTRAEEGEGREEEKIMGARNNIGATASRKRIKLF